MVMTLIRPTICAHASNAKLNTNAIGAVKIEYSFILYCYWMRAAQHQSIWKSLRTSFGWDDDDIVSIFSLSLINNP